MRADNFLSFITGDDLALLIPLMICAIPIVAILTRHQQRMTEVIHGRAHREAVESEMQALRNEVADLRSQLSTHTLAIDSLSQRQKALGDDAVRQRLG